LDPEYASGRTWAPCTYGALVNYFQTKNKKTKVVVHLPNQPPRLSLDPNPGGQGGTILGCSVSTASTVSLGKKNIKEKLKGTSILFGVDQIFGFVIWIWKDICSLT
jgi:hypothetical protein